nr:hypothetical protein [Sinorhizobium sp. RAC02]
MVLLDTNVLLGLVTAIGAHKAVAGWTLITCDAGRCRTYFPGLDLRKPDEKSDQSA